MKSYTVVTSTGEVIAVITREERNRLIGYNDDGTPPRFGAPEYPLFPEGVPEYNSRMIQAHRKQEHVYFALVEQSVILAEIRRDIRNRIPTAEDNVTTKKTVYADPKGKAGWFYEHHERRAFGYATTTASAQDRSDRHFLREEKKSHTHVVVDIFDTATVVRIPLLPPLRNA